MAIILISYESIEIRMISFKNGKLISEESLFGTFWISTSRCHLIHNFYYLEMHSSAVIPSPHITFLCALSSCPLCSCSKSRYWSNPKQSPWLFFTSVVTSQKLFFPWDYFVAKITIKWAGFTRLIWNSTRLDSFSSVSSPKYERLLILNHFYMSIFFTCFFQKK